MLSQFLQVVYQLSYTCDKMTIEYETEGFFKTTVRRKRKLMDKMENESGNRS